MKNSHNSSELFKCNICPKKFQSNAKLENHYSDKHVVKVISLHQCPSCEYNTMNKYYLSDHMKRQHVGDNSSSFVCNKCFKRKRNEYLLTKHMQEHVESICMVCQKTFILFSLGPYCSQKARLTSESIYLLGTSTFRSTDPLSSTEHESLQHK